MPLYNHEAFVGEAIESALRQTFSDFELVICDDGSTDGSLQVASSFKDPRIRIISKENGGTASALNTCLLASTGRLICWLSADDLFEPQKLLEHAKAHCLEDVRFSVAPYGLLEGNTRHSTVQRRFYGNERLLPFLKGNYLNGLSVCLDRTLFLETGVFDARLRYAQDVDKWFDVLSTVPAHFIEGGEPLSYTRLASGHLQAYDPHLNGYLDVLRLNFYKLNKLGVLAYLPKAERSNQDNYSWLLGQLLGNQLVERDKNFFYVFGFGDYFLGRITHFIQKFKLHNAFEKLQRTGALEKEDSEAILQKLAQARDGQEACFFEHLSKLRTLHSVDSSIKATLEFYARATC